MSENNLPDFESMTTAEFEQYLPELFANSEGKVSSDPRLAKFLAANPDCAALVSDLETIAETAKNLFKPDFEPSDDVWTGIQHKLKEEQSDGDTQPVT